MFLLTIIKSEGFITLISGLIIAIVVFVLYNSSWVIRKKKKAEAIQKLKLDSMINVINGTDEFQKATKDLHLVSANSLGNIEGKIMNKVNVSSSEIQSYIFEEVSNSVEIYHEPEQIISKFIFSLRRDLVINGEDKSVRKEIRKIINLYLKIRSFVENLDAKEIATIKKEDLKSYIVNLYSEINAGSEMRESMETLWKIYKEKLDKEQEDWLDKLLNYFKRR